MSQKRKDNKGRILRSGEYQREDGRYEFKYTDFQGRRRSVYSWKLVDTDKAPAEVECKTSLREEERRINKDMLDNINRFDAQTLTFEQCFYAYLDSKRSLKETTRASYLFMYEKYVKNSIGGMKIIGIKYSTIRDFYVSLHEDYGLTLATINTYHVGILAPVFDVCVRDDLIRSNPARLARNVIKDLWMEPRFKRHALTEAQQNALIDYCKRSKDQYTKRALDYLVFLIGTGCRIGEMMGLRWDDVDFENNTISINHEILYTRGEDGKNRFLASTPKTPLSNRKIPMFKEVRELLEREYAKQKAIGFCETVIDGYTNFIFTSYRGFPVTGMSINKTFERLRITYNKEERRYREECGEEFIEMPHFTAHCLRHTFATRLAENPDVVSVKAIQTLMGHSNIRTTMDIYSEASNDHLAETISSMEGRLRLA